jgi:hypothetical protein
MKNTLLVFRYKLLIPVGLIIAMFSFTGCLWDPWEGPFGVPLFTRMQEIFIKVVGPVLCPIMVVLFIGNWVYTRLIDKTSIDYLWRDRGDGENEKNEDKEE